MQAQRTPTAELVKGIDHLTRAQLAVEPLLARPILLGIVVVFVRVIRWWFGLTYLLGGVGGFVAGLIMIALGDHGGFYMIVGGPIIVVLGWVIHPWGLQRAMNGHPLLAPWR